MTGTNAWDQGGRERLCRKPGDWARAHILWRIWKGEGKSVEGDVELRMTVAHLIP